ncbi:hypothetical protein D9M72_603020 [compost metagenome]
MVGRQEQAVTGFLQVQRHWVAHDAGADKSDFSHEKILLFLSFVGASLLAKKLNENAYCLSNRGA